MRRYISLRAVSLDEQIVPRQGSWPWLPRQEVNNPVVIKRINVLNQGDGEALQAENQGHKGDN